MLLLLFCIQLQAQQTLVPMPADFPRYEQFSADATGEEQLKAAQLAWFKAHPEFLAAHPEIRFEGVDEILAKYQKQENAPLIAARRKEDEELKNKLPEPSPISTYSSNFHKPVPISAAELAEKYRINAVEDSVQLQASKMILAMPNDAFDTNAEGMQIFQGGQTQSMPAGFPQYTNTGNPEADQQAYMTAKQTWMYEHPEQYQAMQQNTAPVKQTIIRKAEYEQMSEDKKRAINSRRDLYKIVD